MDLNYSADQIGLRDGAERFLRERYGKAARENAERAEVGFNPVLWAEFAGLGWLGVPIGEAQGGLGMGSIETAILMEQFGRNLVVEPYLSTVIVGAGLVARGGTATEAASLLPSVVEGTRRFAVALSERGAALDPSAIATRAEKVGDGWRLTGAKTPVLDAAAATDVLVSAKEADGKVGVYVLSSKAAGLTSRMFDTVDGRIAADMAFDGAEAVRLGDGADRRNDIAWALDAANAALAADVVGAMQAALDATVAYTRMRVQFGQPLAANQVIRHRLVEMAVKLEEARSLALAANIRVGDAGEAGVRGRAVSAGKVKVSSAARFVCEQAVQLHGAMGVTDELEVGSYLKRAIAADVLFGTPAEHLRRYQSSARAAA